MTTKDVTEIVKPVESAYHAAMRLDALADIFERGTSNLSEDDLRGTIVNAMRNAIEILRWYDWQDDQRRRQELNG